MDDIEAIINVRAIIADFLLVCFFICQNKLP